jgi:nitroreductase
VELYEVMRTTPATRAFTSQAVSDAVVYRILDHARFAPSGGNRQGWHVILLRNEAIRRRIRELYSLGWREYMAHVELGLVPFAPREHGRWSGPAIDLDAARKTPRHHDFADTLDTAPVLLLLIARLSALACVDNGLNRQSIVGGASIYPFAHNILLAARNEGLGGVLTSVLVREEDAVRELLGIPNDHAIAGLIALGKPAQTVRTLRRRPVDQFTTVDRFDGPSLQPGPSSS